MSIHFYSLLTLYSLSFFHEKIFNFHSVKIFKVLANTFYVLYTPFATSKSQRYILEFSINFTLLNILIDFILYFFL